MDDPLAGLRDNDFDFALPPTCLSIPLFPANVAIQVADYTRVEQLQLVAYATELYRRFPVNAAGHDLMDQFKYNLSVMGQMHALARFGHWARSTPVPNVEELFWVAAVCRGCTEMLAIPPGSPLRHWKVWPVQK